MVRIWQLVALMFLSALLVGCGDSDCPTCESELKVVFYCYIGFTPESPDTSWGVFTITSSFFGDPVPDVSNVSWFGTDTYKYEIGFPYFTDNVDTSYTKHVKASMIVAGDSTEFEIAIPEPTKLIGLPEIILANEPFEMNWSKSQDADEYSVKILAYSQTDEFSVYLDTSFLVTDTTFTIPGEYLKAGAVLSMQVGARIGTFGEPGDSANFHSRRIKGYLCGIYDTGTWMIWNIVPESDKVKSDDAKLRLR